MLWSSENCTRLALNFSNMHELYICATFRTELNETNRSIKVDSLWAMNTLKGISKRKTAKFAPLFKK